MCTTRMWQHGEVNHNEGQNGSTECTYLKCPHMTDSFNIALMTNLIIELYDTFFMLVSEHS